VALLFAELESVIDEVTLAVSLIAVPAAVPAVTVRTYVIVPEVLGAMLGLVHVRVASTQVHPAVPLKENAVVFAGRFSVSVTLVAVLGPLLVTTCV